MRAVLYQLIRTGSALVLCWFITGPAQAQAQAPLLDLETRVLHLEQTFTDQGLSALLLQLQRLQQEVRELRGQLEQQQYQLNQLQQQVTGDSADTKDNDAPPVVQYTPPADAMEVTDNTDETALASLPGYDQANQSAERELYRKAFELLKERQYDAAKVAFTELLDAYPQGQFTDSNYYWLGEIGYVTHDYAGALREFNRLVSAYPRSPRTANALLKMGYVFSEQRDQVSARMALQQVIARFPDTAEARLAASRLREFQ